MSELDRPPLDEKVVIPTETKVKIAIGICLAIAIFCIGLSAFRKVPPVEAPPITETVPEDIVIEIDNLHRAKSSWRDGAWCAVEKSSVTSINIVPEYEGPAESVWLVDELVFSQTPDGDVYIAVGPGLHMLGSMKGAFADFENATSITGLHLLETSAVTDMSYIFSRSKFEQIDISMWDTHNVANFAYMLYDTHYTDIVNMNNLDLSNVVDTSYMFADCTAVSNIYWENIDTSHIIKMEGMFDTVGANSYKGKTVFHGKLDTTSCTNMAYMFRWARIQDLTEIVKGFDTSKVTTMKGMFEHGLNLYDLDLSTWDVSQVTDMSDMFAEAICLKTLNMEGWTPSCLQYTDRMFKNCNNLRSFTQWGPAPKIKSAESMFENCYEIREINLSSFNNATLQKADRMFYCNQYIETVICSGLTVKNPAPEMFMWCIGLKAPTPYDELNVSEKMASTTGYFTAEK